MMAGRASLLSTLKARVKDRVRDLPTSRHVGRPLVRGYALGVGLLMGLPCSSVRAHRLRWSPNDNCSSGQFKQGNGC